MNIVAPISTGNPARLPQSYESARIALSECASIDECQTWADKAMALASYARQAEDEELMKMAIRIRDRAIRRAGELLKQIEPQQGGDRKSEEYQRADSGPLITRKEAGEAAGMSGRQVKTAIRIANIPSEDFERQVESPNPPTVTKLAEQGKKAAPRPIIDLKGRDPDEFNRAMHFVQAMERHQRDVEAISLEAILPILIESERTRVRAAIAAIDAFNDRIVTRI